MTTRSGAGPEVSHVQVSGGAGGVEAHYDDLLALAGLLRTSGQTLRRALGDTVQAAAHPALAASIALSPGSALDAEAALLSAAGPGGLVEAAATADGLGRLLQVAVATYRAADAGLTLGQDALASAGGVAVGAALPVLAPVAAVAGLDGLERAAASSAGLVQPVARGLAGV
ncbi:hypothetical protein G9H71_21945, partial [Motilibacter sp. E257]